MVNFSTSQTKENLMRAFAGECQALTRYKIAANVAKKQNMYFIYQIFTQTSDQEHQHAKIFWDLLKEENGNNVTVDGTYPVENVNDVIQLLKNSQHNEFEEHNDVYPSFAKIAEEEGFANIATKFRQIAEIEKMHGERFGAFAELLEQNKMFQADEETEWICLNCGHIHKGKSAPQSCPVCDHPQGYFVPFKYYHFIANDYTKSAL